MYGRGTMAAVGRDERRVSSEWLKKFGAKWAVLAAMGGDCGNRGARIPPDVHDQLRLAQVKIASGRFSPCEIGCALEKVEGKLISIGSSLGEDYLRPWFDLLGQAMEGRIDPRRMSDIPALASIANECKFLACHCDETATLPKNLEDTTS